MKIDVSKIEGYEAMTAEEKVKALESHDIEDVVSKKVFDDAAREASEYKKKWKATLSEKEQQAIEEADKRKEMEARLKQLEDEKQMAEYTAKYVGLGYDNELAAGTAKALLDGDMDTVFSNQQKFADAKEAELKKSLLEKTPKPPAGGDKKMTKEEFMKMSLAEKQEFAMKNPDEYKEFYN